MKKETLIKQVIVLIALAGLAGCNSVDNQTATSKVGYLVAPFDTDIKYQCGDKKSKLDQDGRFECSSFPVNFYLESKKLGYIDSIHNDGYVFPQDIIQNREAIGEVIALATR